jgi:site-specific recombinase XerD
MGVRLMKNAQVLKDFNSYNKSLNLAPTTVEHQSKVINWFNDWVNKPFKNVTRNDIQSTFEYLRENEYVKATIEQIKTVIKKFFKWFYDRERW